jgi:hypothetical protein
MDLGLTTPALLFPAISLLLLAYTNRFLTLANLIRELHKSYKSNPEQIILAQISNLRYRVILIRNMQVYGIASFFLCVLCMFVLFAGQEQAAKIIFGISLIALMVSLAISFREIQISVDALNYRLSDLEDSFPPEPVIKIVNLAGEDSGPDQPGL